MNTRELKARIEEMVDVIKEKDPAIRSNIEVILYPSFWAVINHRIAHSFYKKKHYFIARAISQISRGLTGIEIASMHGTKQALKSIPAHRSANASSLTTVWALSLGKRRKLATMLCCTTVLHWAVLAKTKSNAILPLEITY